MCNDKALLDKTYVKKRVEKSMRKYNKIQREWVYYDIHPRIIAEQILKDPNGEDIRDYKFFVLMAR